MIGSIWSSVHSHDIAEGDRLLDFRFKNRLEDRQNFFALNRLSEVMGGFDSDIKAFLDDLWIVKGTYHYN